MSQHKVPEFADLRGKTLTAIEAVVGGDEIVFRCTDGSVYRQSHSQDCCESVTVEGIVGDLADMIGSPILFAEESRSDAKPGQVSESGTWTFYKLATEQGWLDIRWLGQSNGYYSESVDFEQVAKAGA